MNINVTFEYNTTVNANDSIDRNVNSTKFAIIEDEDISKNILIIICYSLIVIVSISGNLLVCKVAFGTKKMRTTTNLLIASLASSDIIMTSFNIPFNVARLLLLNWPFGNFLCFAVPFVQVACVYVSTITMNVIAIHRWWTLTQTRTNRSSLSMTKIFLIVLTIWVLAGSLALPHSMFNRVKNVIIGGHSLVRCRVDFPKLNFDFPLFLSVEAILTQYIIPLSITLIVYIKIGFIVSKQGKIAGNSSDDRKRRQLKAKRRRIIMLSLAVATFAVCWFPLNLYHLLVDFKVTPKHNSKIFLICHWFAMSSVCYNPLIYCWLNDGFRNGVKSSLQSLLRLCRCECCGNKPHGNSMTTTATTVIEDTEVVHLTNNSTTMRSSKV